MLGLSHSNSNFQEPNSKIKAQSLEDLPLIRMSRNLKVDNKTSSHQVMINTHHQETLITKVTKSNNLEDSHLTNKLRICLFSVKEQNPVRTVALLLINLQSDFTLPLVEKVVLPSFDEFEIKTLLY